MPEKVGKSQYDQDCCEHDRFCIAPENAFGCPFCRCCGVNIGHDDHCPDCACEEYEESCPVVSYCRACGQRVGQE